MLIVTKLGQASCIEVAMHKINANDTKSFDQCDFQELKSVMLMVQHHGLVSRITVWFCEVNSS